MKKCPTCGNEFSIPAGTGYGSRKYCTLSCSGYGKRNRRLLKAKADAYKRLGDKCVCCGESNTIFLTIDHVFDDGALERKKGVIGLKLYQQVMGHRGKVRYQLLCRNCNWAKTRGICPHQPQDERGIKREYAFIDIADLLERDPKTLSDQLPCRMWHKDRP